ADTLVVGGKTGSGDNRIQAVARNGERTSSRATNRTATFVFYVGDRFYGVVTALVFGPSAEHYSFTSALPVEVLRRFAPQISSLYASGEKPPGSRTASASRPPDVTSGGSSSLRLDATSESPHGARGASRL